MARMSLANLVPAAILCSPLHSLLSGKRLVLSFTGRRSGTCYSTPVNYLQRGRELLITTDSRWWHNLDGGAVTATRQRRRRGSGHELRGVVIGAATDLLAELGDVEALTIRAVATVEQGLLRPSDASCPPG
jgi:hypothetical protein